MQFTLELEENKKINFLDMTLIREENGNIITDWYVKPSSSNRILNYLSAHSVKYKRNVILELKNRVTRLSHQKFWGKNFQLITELLKKNNYPIKLINTILYNNRESNYNSHQNTDNQVKYFGLPHIRNLTPSLIKLLSTNNQKLVSYNTKTINNIFSKLKDKTPQLSRSNVVYRIHCNDCKDVYIGQTKQYISRRLQNHKQDCFEKHRQKREKTALAKHHFEKDHNFDLKQADILETEPMLTKRLFLEKIHILKANNTINIRDDSTLQLCTVYANILR